MKTYTKFDLFKIYILNDLFDLNIKRVFHFLKCFFYNKIIKKRPFSIIVETSNLCPYNCPTCPTPRNLIKRPMKNMDFDIFKKIIDNSKNIIYRAILHWTNEPLTNPNIDKFIIYAKKNNLFTEFSTNGYLLDDRISKKLLLAGLDKIEICLDGITKESYKKFRGIDCVEKIKMNIKRFVKLRDKMNKKTIIEIQTIINKYNESEIDKIKQFVKEVGADYHFLKTFGLAGYFLKKRERDYLIKRFLPKHSKIRRYDEKGKPKEIIPCEFIKNTIPVMMDGSVSICCVDFEPRYCLGDLAKENLWNILKKQKTKNMEKKARNKELLICKYC